MLRSALCLLCVAPCFASQFEGLSKVPLVSGLVEQLQETFPGEPTLAIEKAVAEGLSRSLGDEQIDLHEIACARDYSKLCPEGWGDAGDGNACVAPQTYQGKCPRKLDFGGMTAQKRRQQASRCGAYFSCLGACTTDFSKSCPLGWREDVNLDCLAPVGYSGQCVGRKSFESMRKSEKELWAKRCDVTWPCRKTLQETMGNERASVRGLFDVDCIPDYAQACPDRYVSEGAVCTAPMGSSGKCGHSLTSKLGAAEKSAYAEACLTPWPCVGMLH